jgi:hypothetical protein
LSFGCSYEGERYFYVAPSFFVLIESKKKAEELYNAKTGLDSSASFPDHPS